MTELEVVLDENVTAELATIICGDDPPLKYRSGPDLERLFRAAGWRLRDAVEGGRLWWTRERLAERRKDSAMMRALLIRLADRREYVDEPEAHRAVLSELNQLLALEDLVIVLDGNQPSIVRREATEPSRLTSAIPVELTANLAQVVGDATFGGQLQGRLDEAHACWQGGAPTAAVIMMGSLLEGVLFDFFLHHPVDNRPPRDHLETMINKAREQGWISRDVADYAHVLRNHRNLVHPRRQWTDDYSPDPDTVRIAWNVVVAALNDLAGAATRLKTPATRSQPDR